MSSVSRARRGPCRHGQPEQSSQGTQGECDLISTSSQVRVVIADDQALFREGLARLLEEDTRVAVVGQASDGVAAVKLAGSLKPHGGVMDLQMPVPDCIHGTRQNVADNP